MSFLYYILLLSIIVYVFYNLYFIGINRVNIENMDNIDYGDLKYSKKYKKKLKNKGIFFLESGFIRKKVIKPMNARINNNMNLLNNAFGIYKNFLKHI